MPRRRFLLRLGGPACLVSAVPALQTQVKAPRIIGTVRDRFASPIPAARIAITNVQTGIVRRTTTQTDGSYASGPLRLGEYRVRAEHPAFKPAVREGVLLHTQETVVVDLILERGPGPRASLIPMGPEEQEPASRSRSS